MSNKKLKDSKVFCMLPWIHIHTSPTGRAMPCCISKMFVSGVGDSTKDSLIEIVNSQTMNQIRSDMLSDKPVKFCEQCYDHEDQNISSFRQGMNNDYGRYYDEVINDTNSDGTLNNFKMRYFDIRFSNICNMKCRTCGSDYSSQWEQEDKKHRPVLAKILPKNDREDFLQEVLTHIDHIDVAYFAGGEPLITEQHYIMLEEMIKRGRTNISLRYNTNLSNLKFKDKDLLSLWKKFTNGISIYASLDHYGAKAEYIRKGTDWGQIESNLKIIRSLDYINSNINTVVSLYNYTSINEFYEYLIKKNLYSPKDSIYSLYNMHSPLQLASHVLPFEFKQLGREKIDKLKTYMTNLNFNSNIVNVLSNVIKWTESKDTWIEQKDHFKKFTQEVDQARNEDFTKVFPELSKLMD
jgi:MoaA/NifB/PqqE/SkfB family radical SAM enzyme